MWSVGFQCKGVVIHFSLKLLFTRNFNYSWQCQNRMWGDVSCSAVINIAKGILLKFYGALPCLGRRGFIRRYAATKNIGKSWQPQWRQGRSLAADQQCGYDGGEPTKPDPNWNQMGPKIIPATSWMREQEAAHHAKITGDWITLMFCTRYGWLPTIHKGNTVIYTQYRFPEDLDITRSPKQWTTRRQWRSM